MNHSSKIKVLLSISCDGLQALPPKKWLDPLVKVKLQETEDNFEVVGATETLWNTLTPAFKTQIPLTFSFGSLQIVKFEVINRCRSYGKKRPESPPGEADDQTVGIVQLLATELITCLYGRKTLQGEIMDETGTPRGNLNVIVSRPPNHKQGYILTEWAGDQLPVKEFFKTTDACLEIFKKDEQGNNVHVYTTEVAHKKSNPIWRSFMMNKDNLSENQIFEVVAHDVALSGERTRIGSCQMDLAKMRDPTARWSLYQGDPVRKNEEPKFGGTLHIRSFYENHVCLTDYILSFTKLVFSFVIDCSLSTKDFHQRKTPESFSVVEDAMRVFEPLILQHGSSEIPLLGFGGKLGDNVISSQYIILNGTENDPYCQSMKECLAACRTNIPLIQASEPTCLGPPLKYINNSIVSNVDGPEYHVVVVITDGKVDDTMQTADALIQASKLPVSVSVICVGNYSAEYLKELAGETLTRKAIGDRAERNVLSVVHLNNAKDIRQVPRIALDAMPEQFMEFMTRRKITPPQK